MERIFVTGASRGLGREFVRQYLSHGCHVFAGCRAPEQAHELAALADDSRGTLDILRLDVADEEAIEAALSAVESQPPGHLDVLVNNAGLSPRGERFGNVEAQRMLSVFAVNTVAAFMVAQRAVGSLAAGQRPRLVNVSSSMGSLTQKDYGRHYSYGASKAALNMITRASAHDLAERGITVTALHPGWVRTDLGGEHAALDPATSVSGMIGVIERLTLADSGCFYTWAGEYHPW
jgi:NAD(P)-dependent dehydrogenase (short-subunit alcohol dehydrogenase family)